MYAVVDDRLSPTSPLGDAVDTFVRREDAERFIEQVRRDEPEFASYLRIEERGLRGGRAELSKRGRARQPLDEPLKKVTVSVRPCTE